MWAVRICRYSIKIISPLAWLVCRPPRGFSLLPGRLPATDVTLMFKIIINNIFFLKKKGNSPNLYFIVFKMTCCVLFWTSLGLLQCASDSVRSKSQRGESWTCRSAVGHGFELWPRILWSIPRLVEVKRSQWNFSSHCSGFPEGNIRVM